MIRVDGYAAGSEPARLMRQRSRVEQDVLEISNVSVMADMKFYKASHSFDLAHLHRPYLFYEGHIQSITVPGLADIAPELHSNAMRVDFGKDSSPLPDISVHWNLRNDEIIELVKKEIFGSDWSIDKDDPNALKPIGEEGIEKAQLFTNSVFEGVPVTGALSIYVDTDTNGKQTPIVVFKPNTYNGIVYTNSRVTDYADISVYFPDKPHYENYVEPNDLGDKVLVQSSILDVQKSAGLSAEPKPYEMQSSKPGNTMTPSELAESEHVSELQGNVAERIAAHYESERIDEIARKAEQLDVPDASDDTPQKAVSADDKAVVDSSVLSPDVAVFESGDSDESGFDDAELESMGLGQQTETQRIAEEKVRKFAKERENKHASDVAKAVAEGEKLAKEAESDGDDYDYS